MKITISEWVQSLLVSTTYNRTKKSLDMDVVFTPGVDEASAITELEAASMQIANAVHTSAFFPRRRESRIR